MAVVKYWEDTKVKAYRSLKVVQHKFPFVKILKTLYRWKTQIDRNGSKFHKFKLVNDYLNQKFQNSRQNNISVHDCDLKRWALCYSKENNIDFKASPFWLHKFKRRNKIRSRKITTFVCKPRKGKIVDVEKSAKAYINDIKILISDMGLTDDQVFNSDQSGFNKEIHFGRTLNEIGSRKIVSTVQHTRTPLCQ